MFVSGLILAANQPVQLIRDGAGHCRLPAASRHGRVWSDVVVMVSQATSTEQLYPQSDEDPSR